MRSRLCGREFVGLSGLSTRSIPRLVLFNLRCEFIVSHFYLSLLICEFFFSLFPSLPAMYFSIFLSRAKVELRVTATFRLEKDVLNERREMKLKERGREKK